MRRKWVAGVVVVAVLIMGAVFSYAVTWQGDSAGQTGQPTVSPPDGGKAEPGLGTGAQPALPSSGPPILNPLSEARFAHPGVLVTPRQLEFVRQQVIAGNEPWRSAFGQMYRSSYANLSWQPKPRAVVECGPYSQPDYGCKDEEADGVAAYTHALMWYLTGDERHAAKACEIIDAWSGVLQTHTNRNAPLQAAWSGASLVRAAELLRHTYSGWKTDHVRRAEHMFRNVFLPVLMTEPGLAGGNWDLIMLDARIGIGVFLDDRGVFHQAIDRWRLRVRAYIYLTTDGSHPHAPPGVASGHSSMVSFWFGQTIFVNGLTQETCRDFGHTGWGLSALAHVAETARIQGHDLFSDVPKRVTSALELHSEFELAGAVPHWLCGGFVNRGFHPSPEIAYNAYVTRLGHALPHTKSLVEKMRPESAGFFYGWETLTHANNPY